MAAQNIYDSPDFFAQYGKLPRSVRGLDGAPEWPTLRRMVGSVKDSTVLDLGCGYGWFCRWARTAGAQSVHGIDVSRKMLERAQSYPDDAGITHECRDLQQGILLPFVAYDLVYSSLTLHYLPDLGSLFEQVVRALKPGGKFVFSVEHPIMSAPSDAAWKRDSETGVPYWPLNHYIDEDLRVTNWLEAAEVRKYHYMVETYLTALLNKGFVLRDYRDFWDDMERKSTPDRGENGQRPDFLLIGAQLPLHVE